LVELNNMNNQKNVKTSFWDLKTPKVYTTGAERALDFWVSFWVANSLIGFFLTKVISFQYRFLGEIHGPKYSYPISELLPVLIPFLIVVIFMILGFVYFWNRRRYIVYGLLTPLILSILMLIMVLRLPLRS